MTTPCSPTFGVRHRVVRGSGAAAAMLVLLVGCGDPGSVRPGDIRHYVAPKEAVPSTREGRGSPPSPGQAAERLAIRYEPPPGWTDRGGSGMRLATLAIGGPDEGLEVTVIPASGSLEANVARWLGQLDPAATPEAVAERAAAALSAAEPVASDGTKAMVVALFAGPTAAAEDADAGEAILAGVIPIDDTGSLFVKFKGPAEVARRERENFTRFVSSIRWK